MTDEEIVSALIERNRFVTRQFFYVNCRPLLTSVINKVFDYAVEYDEFVNELYQLLMADDARRLRQFDFRSSIYQWLKTVAIRHFAQKKSLLIDNSSKFSPIKTEEGQDFTGEEDSELVNTESRIAARIDLERLLSLMANERYAFVIRKLMLEDVEPKALAKDMGVTIENLYNIKKRAMAVLTKVALKDIKKYGKDK
jgi:RNA polymerase sigma factor (sigma-70 family)